jgi:glycosyltransferase involved in cell wall biosynthesis
MSKQNARSEVLSIDCQVFQSIALHRGMGKYSMNFLTALLPKLAESGTQVVLLFNKNRPLEKEAKKQLQDIAAKTEFTFLDLETPDEGGYEKAIRDNKRFLETYIAENFSGKSASFMILSLFLGNAAASAFPANTYRIILFYDLIPLLYFKRYAQYVNFGEYLVHFKTVYEADMVLTISQTVADDMALYLGLPEEAMVNINGAAIDRGKIKPKTIDSLKGKKFILMPTGDELRKNNHRAVEAFEKFNNRRGGEYRLVLTSFFNSPTIEALERLSKDIVFTGNIREEELQWLYVNAELLLFATEYEGLGLPILEAMTVDKPILCSDIPVFREISDDAMYYFDPLNIDDIAETIDVALNDRNFSSKAVQYPSVLQRYTWEESANAFLKAFSVKRPIEQRKKKKIALVAPDPTGFSAIGKVVAESHSAMSKLFDVDYYFDKGPYHKELRMDYLSWLAGTESIVEFDAKKYAEYDAVIYHIGNSDYHLRTIVSALTLPGYAIFHDVYLEGAYEMLGTEGYMSAERIALEEALNAVGAKSSSYISSLVSAQSGVLCHSEYASKALREADSEVPIQKVDLPVSVPAIQRNLHVDRHHKLNVCFAGIIHEVKGTNIIKKLARELGVDDIHISIFGFDLGNKQLIDELKALVNVELVQNPTDFEFQNLLAKQHILINYRTKYRGETSLTALESMRYGVVPIVRDIGWYGELDREAVVAVKSEDEIYEQILALHADRKRLQAMSRKARNFVLENNSHERYAQKIYDFIESNEADNRNGRFIQMVRKGTPVKQLAEKLFE